MGCRLPISLPDPFLSHLCLSISTIPVSGWLSSFLHICGPSVSPFALLALHLCLSQLWSCSFSVSCFTQFGWQSEVPTLQLAPPGPSSVFSVDKIDPQPPIPTWESGPRGPIIPREIFHPPSPRPHPLPQSIGYIPSQGMSGSLRHFLRAWGWEGAWEWSLLRSCWSRSLHNFKPHPPFVVMPPAINRGSQSIFFKNKHQTGLTWPEKQPLAGAHPSSVPVSSHPRWLAELERKLGVRRRRGSLQDATWTG